MPAFATITSSRPNRRCVSATSRATSASTDTSHGVPATAPSDPSSFTAAWTDSARNDETITEAPSFSSAAAAARPMPRVPSVPGPSDASPFVW